MTIRESMPTKAIVGFVPMVSSKEAYDFARDAAKRYFESVETSKVCVQPFDDGYLYEAHEAGGGTGHLSAVILALADGRDRVWFPVSKKVVTVEMIDGKPVGLVLPKEQGVSVMRDEPTNRVFPTDRMHHVLPKGRALMAAGVTFAVCGLAALFGAMGYDIMTRQGYDITSVVEIADLPYRQWGQVEDTPVGLFVESLRYDATRPADDRWVVTRRQVERDPTVPLQTGGNP